MKTCLCVLALLLSVLIPLDPRVSALSNVDKDKTAEVIVDSKLSEKEAIGIQLLPDYIRKELCLVDVRYYSFDKKLHQGQLVINKGLRADVVYIFRELEKIRFPIAKAIPVSKYDYSDEASMEDNNTSGFNYRPVSGTKVLSYHAYGRAIDINPQLNPFIRRGTIQPKGAKYDPRVSGSISMYNGVVKIFKRQGWKWGGAWKSVKDYQHFEKAPIRGK